MSHCFCFVEDNREKEILYKPVDQLLFIQLSIERGKNERKKAPQGDLFTAQVYQRKKKAFMYGTKDVL